MLYPSFRPSGLITGVNRPISSPTNRRAAFGDESTYGSTA
jgi:hypothetical protein